MIITLIAEFLAYQQSLGKSGSTINGYRSALCGVFGVLLGVTHLAKHPLLSGVVNAARNERPVQPRYDDIWDAGLIPRYWSRTRADTLESKRAKAISLSMLAIFARPSDMARISALPQHFELTPQGYKFRIRGAKEGKCAARLTPVLYLHYWTEQQHDNNLGFSCCPAEAWQDYFTALELANPVRLPLNAMVYPQGQFLALTKQNFVSDDGSVRGRFHKPIGSQRISKVMKFVMEAAGVDTAVFTGGSARAAGSSAAFDRRCDIEYILSRGRWSSFETFRKFYLRSRVSAEALEDFE